MKAEPQKEHQWLERLVGEWNYEHEAVMEPGKPPVKFTGKESVRSIGGLWTLGEGEGEMPGGGATTTLMMLGYDTAKGRFVGTFTGSMMTQLWIYEGELDSTGKVLTLDTEGPSFSGDGTISKYKDVIEIKSDDHRLLRSSVLGDNGEWHEFMVGHYHRTK